MAVQRFELPLAFEVADDPVIEVGDRVVDLSSAQVGEIMAITPAGYYKVNWLIWMCGSWHKTHQHSMCAGSEIYLLA